MGGRRPDIAVFAGIFPPGLESPLASTDAPPEQEAQRRDASLFVAAQAVIAVGSMAAARGWVPATAGNFSVRIDSKRIAITRSGAEKGDLKPSDIIAVPLAEPKVPGISAEAPLHVALYADRKVGAVWHVHSPAGVIASRLAEKDGAITLKGWELQKVLGGITSHEQTVVIPVVSNDQDTERLADVVTRRFAQPLGDAVYAPGYLVAGHGLTAWGSGPQETWRRLEALETMIAPELEYQRRR
jgi:methylthioribulose-1-phosphate dehydratase